MKFKLVSILLFGIFLISFISSTGSQLPLICGGDNELLVGCIGDDELQFLAGDIPSAGGGPGTPGAEYTTVPPIEEIPFIEQPTPSIFARTGLDKLEYGTEFFFIFLFLFVSGAFEVEYPL